MSSEVIVHPFDPVFDGNSKVLILGSFPSVKSRENEFYYGHERNRFWRVISALYSEHLPETVEQKKSLLLRHNIALWDTAASCTVHASSDSSIRNVMPNDINTNEILDIIIISFLLISIISLRTTYHLKE